MATKAQIINDAYSQLRISGITVIPNSAEVELALDRLEDMMHEFSGRNICIGYNFEESPDPNSEAEVDRKFSQLLKTNLAVRLIPDYNKEVPAVLMRQASQSLSSASSVVASDTVRQVQYPETMPRGSGNTIRYNHFRRYQRPDKQAPNECETNGLVEGDINDYTESFANFLRGDEISGYEISGDAALKITSDSSDAENVYYRIEALNKNALGSWQQVKIVITTSSGRINTRLINFDVSTDNTVGGL